MTQWRDKLPSVLIETEKEFCEEDGKYYFEYVWFGKSSVQLDGWFTIEQLRYLADAMEDNPYPE